MPAANEYRPDDRAVREAAESELRQRREGHAAAWRYYEGKHRRQMLTRPGEPDDNVVVNLTRQAVDRLTAFLVPAFPGLELDRLHETESERWLRNAWQMTGGARLLAKLVKNGCMDGHVFVRVQPGDPYPRLVTLNPANVLVFWQADDHEQILWYELHWSVGRADFRQDIVRQEQAWLIRDWRREIGPWELTGEHIWPYALGPLIDWPHDPGPDRYYGSGETGNLALNDRVNKVASDISRILRYHASPRTVGTGFEAEDVTATSIDNLWTIADPDARVFNLEMTGDLQSSMGFLDFCTRAFMAERRVVVPKAEFTDLRHVTNLGIRALFMDQITRTVELQRSYEVGIVGISQRLLMLHGQAGQELVKVIWPDPLPTDTAETVGVLERERALGIVSRETAAIERGRDWALEQARMQTEGETLTPGLSPSGRGESQGRRRSRRRAHGGRDGASRTGHAEYAGGARGGAGRGKSSASGGGAGESRDSLAAAGRVGGAAAGRG
jgi:hypothetical protein